MARINPRNTENTNRKDVKRERTKSIKNILSDMIDFVIYDKNEAYIDDEYFYKDNAINFKLDDPDEPIVEFTKANIEYNANHEKNLIGNKNIKINQEQSKRFRNIRLTAIKDERRKKYIIKAVKRKKIEKRYTTTQTFDGIKIEDSSDNIRIMPPGHSYGYGYAANMSDTEAVITEAELALQKIRRNSRNIEIKEQSRRRDKIKNKAALFYALKRIIIVLFAAVTGAVTMPFGMNPMGVSLICAADKYIFYIYSGLVISLAFTEESAFMLFAVYSVAAAVKFYVKYSKGKTKSHMLSSSQSYRNLSVKEKSKLMNLVHFNDTGSIIVSLLISAITGCIVGVFRIALKMPNIIYTDIIVVILFVLVSMLFTYLYSGLFEIGKENRVLEKAGICAVIFTLVYALAPFYIYSLSLGYIFSFVLTLLASSSGVNKKYAETERQIAKEQDSDENNENSEDEDDEDVINRFRLNSLSQDGALSDMTRGALIGFLCGKALGDTAGAVTLGICGLISGLFFAQSVTLAVIAGLISAISYSVYIAGIDAVRLYIPNMIIGLTFYLPVSAAYLKSFKIDADNTSGNKEIPFLDKGLLVTEMPAIKLNNLSDAFNNLSSTFYELSERLKKPSFMEIKAICAASVEKICETCGNREFCGLNGKTNFNAMQKKCAEYIAKKSRLDKDGFTQAYREHCVRLAEIESKINSLYLGRLDENMKNDRTKIFASHYENIAKLLNNNSKSGREDVAFKRELSEQIFKRLQNMGIDSENVIVIGERQKTIYVFGIKMVDYSGTIEDIINMFEKTCDIYLDEPEYILKENYVIMKIQSRNKFKIYSMYMSKAAGDADGGEENVKELNNFSFDMNAANIKKEINGDSAVVFDGDGGYFYGVVSDGMGSGKNAALSSRLTVLLMEKLLSVGNQKDLTLEMLNSLLLAKNDECFASVDLFEADLITGKASFIKAGAAPSFVVRNNRLFKIQSSTVPAGIISNMNSEQTKFDLEEGDYVLMLSDGIISTFEEGTWLIEMLSSDKNLREPKRLLNNILRQAREKNIRKDDMSVLFMKVAGEER